jgi:hypothetical protein
MAAAVSKANHPAAANNLLQNKTVRCFIPRTVFLRFALPFVEYLGIKWARQTATLQYTAQLPQQQRQMFGTLSILS